MNIYSLSRPASANRTSDSSSQSDSFGLRCQIHLDYLLEFRSELDSIEQVFGEDQIWADQIEDSMVSFKGIQGVIRNIPRLFKMENRYYTLDKECRYRVIVNSQYVHHQIIEAIDLAKDMETKGKISKQNTHKNIKYMLSQIKSNLDDLIKDLEYSIP